MREEGDSEDKNKQDQNNQKNPQNKDDKQQPPQNPKRKPGQISPEQVKSLLEAMNQQEKKVQDKVNAKKKLKGFLLRQRKIGKHNAKTPHAFWCYKCMLAFETSSGTGKL